ncbi:MAG: HNH endonuclease [Planctomycetaceae bacterium]|jgi:site-specific DNA-methyltransferase (adenine-specific)|nr:HNH endonuclease [Planctomycetaceae bacterium]
MLGCPSPNTLYTNDNLYVLSGLNSESVDLIYLDPPFNSKRMYSAPAGSKAAGANFKDIWTWKDVDEYHLDSLAEQFPALARYIADIGVIHSKPMMAYLTYMLQRIIEMHRILKETGSLYLHCDPTASHYLKLLLDSIFGKQSFRNEIIWCYTGPGSPQMRQFNRKHDTIFWYTKSGHWTFNKDAVRLPYKDGSPHSGGFVENDGTRLKSDKYTRGKVPETWWQDIAIVARSKYERTGYPTQKPLALLKRIILASSNEGDMVLDPFCGCATTCVASQQLGRKWIGIDIEKQAVKILVERLSGDAGLFKDFTATNQIPKRSDIKEEQPTKSVKERLYKKQNGKCNTCGKDFDLQNLEIDHIVPKSKGGGDYYDNYQLLCANCNRIKGDRPMEYLRLKIETRERMMKNRIFFGE